MTLTVTFTAEEVPELRKVLNRAMNTWDPHDQPAWLGELSDQVDRILAGSAKSPKLDLEGLVKTQIEAQHDLAFRQIEMQKAARKADAP